jgi:chemotaxis protein MotA
MRVALGLGLLALTFACAYWLLGLGLHGYLNPPALVLIGFGPLAVAAMSYEPRDIAGVVGTCRRALSFREVPAARLLAQGLATIAQAHRSGRPQETVQLAENAHDDMVRQVALLLLQHYDEHTARELFVARTQAAVARIKRAEDFYASLSRLAPSFGLIGTIVGFVDLLRHLSDPASLGPGMAMALTATLYGISLSYCVYHPLAKSVGCYGRKLWDLGRTAEQALTLMSRGRYGSELAFVLGEMGGDAAGGRRAAGGQAA